MIDHFFALLFVAAFVLLTHIFGRRLISRLVLGALTFWLFVSMVPFESFTKRFETFSSILFLFSVFLLFKFKPNTIRLPVKLLGQLVVIYSLIQFSSYLYAHAEQYVTPLVVYLTLGYDNGVHLENFVSVALAGGSIDFRGYPMGLYSFWYLCSRILNLPISEPNEILMTFFALTILTWAFSIFASAGVILKGNTSRTVSILKIAILVLAITFGVYGFMLTSGYPPYTFAIAIVLLLIAAMQTTSNLPIQLAMLAASFIIGLLVMPLVIAIVIPLTVSTMWSYLNSLKWFVLFRTTKLFVPSSALILAISLLVFYWFLRNYGVNQVFEPGGIEPLRYRWLLAISILSLLLFFASKKKVFHPPVYVSNIVVSCLSISIVLAMLTLNVNGAVTYYAIKEFQVLGFLLLVLLLGITTNKMRTSRLLLATAYISCFALILQPALQPRQFTTGFMGTTQNAIRVVFQPSDWEYQIVDAPFLVRAVDEVELSSSECGVIWTKEHNATLSGRWFNASYPKFAGNCYNIYYDSDNQTDEEVISEVANPDIDVVVVVDDRPLSDLQVSEISKSGDRVERID